MLGGFLYHAVYAQSDLASFNFKKIISDNKGHRYIIGDIQNNDVKNNIESQVYFTKSDLESAYYVQNVGVIGHNMAIPFKIDLAKFLHEPDLNDIKISSHVTLAQPLDFLQVDYASLHKDPVTHAISGMINNTSSLDMTNVQVYAIAMSKNSTVLDVASSDLISYLSSNGSAQFTLVPLDSVSKYVGYYSCFVPGGPVGTNYTLAGEGGKTMQFEIQSDGKIKNVGYDAVFHTVNFQATGVFPMGGWVELMMASEPDSFARANSFNVTVNGEKPERLVVSSEMIGNKTYQHISLVFPLGYNDVSIKPIESIPEFPISGVIVVSFVLLLLIGVIYKHKLLHM
jgi:hypothetical protein